MVAALHGCAGFRQFRADAIDVVTHVYLVQHGLFVRVGGDEVLIEETERVRRRRGGEADVKGIEVIEDAFPEVVDGAVTFIDDDDVESLGRERGIVGDRGRLVGVAAASKCGPFVVGVVNRLARKGGV
jgi:hypothetical protein